MYDTLLTIARKLAQLAKEQGNSDLHHEAADLISQIAHAKYDQVNTYAQVIELNRQVEDLRREKELLAARATAGDSLHEENVALKAKVTELSQALSLAKPPGDKPRALEVNEECIGAGSLCFRNLVAVEQVIRGELSSTSDGSKYRYRFKAHYYDSNMINFASEGFSVLGPVPGKPQKFGFESKLAPRVIALKIQYLDSVPL